METTLIHPAVKTVGSNGQISIGKRYAGRQVLIEESEPGVITVRMATVIPDNERWLHEPEAAAALQAAMQWAVSTPTKSDNADETLQRMINADK